MLTGPSASTVSSVVDTLRGELRIAKEVIENSAESDSTILENNDDFIISITKIRDILGSTDPSKARPGSVRREFGSNIMVNSAHASDSPENAARELEIINVEDDTTRPWVDQYCE